MTFCSDVKCFMRTVLLTSILLTSVLLTLATEDAATLECDEPLPAADRLRVDSGESSCSFLIRSRGSSLRAFRIVHFDCSAKKSDSSICRACREKADRMADVSAPKKNI